MMKIVPIVLPAPVEGEPGHPARPSGVPAIVRALQLSLILQTTVAILALMVRLGSWTQLDRWGQIVSENASRYAPISASAFSHSSIGILAAAILLAGGLAVWTGPKSPVASVATLIFAELMIIYFAALIALVPLLLLAVATLIGAISRFASLSRRDSHGVVAP
jgi:hypothetical protein